MGWSRCYMPIGTVVQLHPHERRGIHEHFGVVAGYDISHSKYQIKVRTVFGLSNHVYWMFDNEVSVVGEELR